MIRNLAFAFLLMLICSGAASATDITISTFTINNFQRPGTTAQVRIWYSTNLVDSLGQPVLGGPVGSSMFKIVSCRLDRVTKVLTIPAFTIPSTNDSSAPKARVTARIYDSTGRPVTYLWTKWVIPYQLGSTLTFAQLNAYNGAPAVVPTYPTTNQVGSLIFTGGPSSRTMDTTAAADAGPNDKGTLVAADFNSSSGNNATEYSKGQSASASRRDLIAADNSSKFAKLSASNIFTGTPQTMPAIAMTGGGVVFDAGISNLPNELAIGTNLPQRFGLSAGTNTLPSTSRNPTVSMITYGAPPAGGGGTTVPYYFGYHRKAGSTQRAVYTQLTYTQTDDASATAQNLVGVASITAANSGSTTEVFAFYGEAQIHNQNTGQGAVGAELDVFNLSGVDAPAPGSVSMNGFTEALDLVGKGGKKNTAAIVFQIADTNSAFWTLMDVRSDVIASGGYGIDFNGATRGNPIRLPNLGTLPTGYIYGRNHADNADKKLLGITSADQVSIDGDGMGTVFGGNISLTKTITPAGITGEQTINKTSGSVNFSVRARSLVVTNSFVSSTSVVQCTVATNDVTMKSAQCVAGSGSLTIFPNAAPTAETRVNFTVTN
jgi:hypothetical protein